MNIKLDYNLIICDKGHTNLYTNKQCEVCGEEFNSQLFQEIDPYVSARISALQPIFNTIILKKAERKAWFKEFRKSRVNKYETDKPIDIIIAIISDLFIETTNQSLDNLDLRNDSIKNDHMAKEIESICNIINATYNLLFKSERTQFSLIFKNINNRVTSAIRLYLEAYETLFNAAIATTNEDSSKMQIDAQNKLDFASNEISILNKIIDNASTSLNYEMVEQGQPNLPIISSMIYSNSEDTFPNILECSNRMTYYYFNGLIEKNYENFKDDFLINLSTYRYLGMSVFDDLEYLKKTKIVLRLLTEAFQKNSNSFKQFFSKYLENYMKLHNILNETSKNIMWICSNTPPADIIISNCINWYKNLSEGAYREASRIIYFSYKVISDKDVDIDEILIWKGFTEILGEIENANTHNIDILTKGIDTIIRHSEAHVDYDIDKTNQNVVMRNKNHRTKEINEKKYTFEDFFDKTNTLIETLSSIICGIQLFLYNNSSFFNDEIEQIESNDNQPSDTQIISMLFGMTGIVIEDDNKIISNNKTQLCLKGQYIYEKNIEQLSQNIYSVCGGITKQLRDIDSIMFTLIDNNKQELGSIIIYTQFAIEFSNCNDSFKNYFALLMKMTSIQDGIFIKDVIINKDFICLKSVFTLLCEPIKKFKDALRDTQPIYNSRIKEEMNEVILDIRLIERFISIYESFENDTRIIEHLKMVNNQILLSFNEYVKKGISTPIFYFENIEHVIQLLQKSVNVLTNEISLQEYLQEYLKSPYAYVKHLNVNDSCPCGSGKKYKKCCKK